MLIAYLLVHPPFGSMEEQLRRLENALQEEQRRRVDAEQRRKEEQCRREEAELRQEEEQRRREEEQRRREEEQRRREEEQRRREEEQRRREEAELRQEEEQRRREEEQRRREEAELRQEEEQRLRKEEQRRREIAEQRTRPTTLPDFLQRCHDLYSSINVVLDKSLTTRGDITTPNNRLYPKNILPWTDFAERQAATWQCIGESPTFSTDHMFSSPSDFEYVYKQLRPIASEQGLRRFESLTVESMVSELFKRLGQDETMKQILGLEGETIFQDHTNLGNEGNAELERAMQGLRLQQNTKRAARQQSPYRHRGTADQFCVLKSDEDGSTRPVVAIEYKAPHKLTTHIVALGLKTEIDTYRDVISKIPEVDTTEDQQNEVSWCQFVMAAVVTQLFSYMVAQGTRYGYICTGQAYVFLRIGDEPSNVYYSVHIPSLDFNDIDPLRLHRTAVARVFALIMLAIPEAGLDQDWHQRITSLSPWQVDARDVIYQMPDSIRTNASDSDYIPDVNVECERSPIKTRASCRPDENRWPQGDEDSGSDAGGRHSPQSPSRQQQLRSQARAKGLISEDNLNRSNTSAGRRSGRGSESRPQGIAEKPDVVDRPYCSHTCLYGLAVGGATDRQCPNFDLHGQVHPSKADFLQLVKQQLLSDTGKDAYCAPLYIHGARGGLLKICLKESGYTFLGKGMEIHNLKYLRNERKIYDQLLPLQGKYVPVCLGLIKLQQGYYYSAAKLSHLLLLSWGGRPLPAPANREYRGRLPKMAEEALTAVHQCKVLHKDAEPRNMVFDAACIRLMVIDFERSQVRARQALTTVRPNSAIREAEPDKQGCCGSAFDMEMKAMRNCFSHYLR